jgi:hypothetical protein
MKQMSKLSRMVAGLGLAVLLGFAAVACSSTPNGGGETDAEYVLWVTLENNLMLNEDILWVKFHGENSAPTGGQVSVDGEIVLNDPNAVQITQHFAGDRWTAGAWIVIMATDSAGTVVYRDSLKIPQEFAITNVNPFNEPWRPGRTASIEWQTSSHAVGFAVSVTPPTGSDALGYAEYDESQSGLSETFTQEVFSNRFDIVRNGDYRVQVTAYNPNFVPRDDVDFKTPEFDQIPQPITTSFVTGALSALTVSDAETITVETLR